MKQIILITAVLLALTIAACASNSKVEAPSQDTSTITSEPDVQIDAGIDASAECTE